MRPAPLRDEPKASPSCAELIAEAKLEPALAPPAKLDAVRRKLLMTAKAEPVVFVTTPGYVNEPFLPSIARDRALLERTEHPWDVLKRLIERYKIAPKEGRETLLKDGYLYTENPDMAFALVNQVSAEHLFGHDRIWIERGTLRMHAERRLGRYWFVDGPNQGDMVRLLLFDRIGSDEAPSEPLTRDFRTLQYQLHFTAARVQFASKGQLVAELQYGNVWVPTLLRSSGTTLTLQCEIPGSDESAAQLQTHRREAARRQRSVQGLRSVILDEVDEQLPFDEPRREWGLQLDGKLRSNWLHAYERRQKTFALNGDAYDVFDRKGRPLVPQVCVDFLADTFERYGGSWFRRQNEQPGRTAGKWRLTNGDIHERTKFRRVPEFIAWAQANPDKFEVLALPEAEGVPLGERDALLAMLETHKADFQPGDVVVIRGATPWDPIERHYHSFFIFENDPMTGIPLSVVGNAGRPTIRTLETEARRTPERKILFRLRPRTDWLEHIAAEERRIPEDPLPLSPRGNAGW